MKRSLDGQGERRRYPVVNDACLAQASPILRRVTTSTLLVLMLLPSVARAIAVPSSLGIATLKNALYDCARSVGTPQRPVQLTDGVELVTGKWGEFRTELIPEYVAYGPLTKTGETYAAVILRSSSGGSGSFSVLYVCLDGTQDDPWGAIHAARGWMCACLRR